jgi:hypothetical protein
MLRMLLPRFVMNLFDAANDLTLIVKSASHTGVQYTQVWETKAQIELNKLKSEVELPE